VRNDYETTFGIISLSTSELLSLNVNSRNFLLAASMITNDIRFIWQLIGRSPIDGANDDLLSMQMIRRLWSVRKVAGAVYDGFEGLKPFIGKIPALKQLSKDGTPVIPKEQIAQKFMNLAKSLRHRNSHFYSAKIDNGFDRHLNDPSENIQHRIFAHIQNGNSISELAEQVFTLREVLNYREGTTLGQFEEWCLRCSGSIVKFCNIATVKVILEAFPDKVGETRSIPVINEAFGLDHRWPLFSIIGEDAN
jgi:hypothetical protein